MGGGKAGNHGYRDGHRHRVGGSDQIQTDRSGNPAHNISPKDGPGAKSGHPKTVAKSSELEDSAANEGSDGPKCCCEKRKGENPDERDADFRVIAHVTNAPKHGRENSFRREISRARKGCRPSADGEKSESKADRAGRKRKRCTTSTREKNAGKDRPQSTRHIYGEATQNVGDGLLGHRNNLGCDRLPNRHAKRQPRSINENQNQKQGFSQHLQINKCRQYRAYNTERGFSPQQD